MQTVKNHRYVLFELRQGDCRKRYYVSACGAPAETANQYPGTSDKDWLTTLLLCFFLGGFGVHSFYTGKALIGVLQLITLGGCGIWALIDFIMIIVGSYKDAQGLPIVNKR